MTARTSIPAFRVSKRSSNGDVSIDYRYLQVVQPPRTQMSSHKLSDLAPAERMA
jgi:hypothetical protein